MRCLGTEKHGPVNINKMTTDDTDSKAREGNGLQKEMAAQLLEMEKQFR